MRKILLLVIILSVSFHGQAQEVDLSSFDSSMTLREFLEEHFQERLQYISTIKESSDSELNKKPLIIINRYPLTDRFWILENIFLSDIKMMDYNADEELSKLYGTATRYGLMSIKMNKRKWRKLRKHYGK